MEGSATVASELIVLVAIGECFAGEGDEVAVGIVIIISGNTTVVFELGKTIEVVIIVVHSLDGIAFVFILLLLEISNIIVCGIVKIEEVGSILLVVPAGDPPAVGVVLVAFGHAIGVGYCGRSTQSIIFKLSQGIEGIGYYQLGAFADVAGVFGGVAPFFIPVGVLALICCPEDDAIVGVGTADPPLD